MATIEEIYNTIIKNLDSWIYWNYNDNVKEEVSKIIPDFQSIFEVACGGNIINRLLHIGEKKNSVIALNVDKLDYERKRHIVSLFFLGHVIYNKVLKIKNQVDTQLSFQDFPQRDRQSNERIFSFIWLLLCLFHDLGYAYEYGKIEICNKNLIDLSEIFNKLKYPLSPSILNVSNIEKYDNYRQCKWGVKDHGIWGGKVFYNDMLSIKDNLKQNYITDDTELFCHDGVDHIYAFAAWIIMCHNINFNNTKDDYTNCYKCQGLDDFIIPKARCISIKNNPLLFLFCFADTIEPTKKLYSKDHDPKKDMSICKKLKLDFQENTIKFILDDLDDLVVGVKYKENLIGMNNWLIDVSDDLTIKFE